MNLGERNIDQVLVFTANTFDPTTGEPSDADAAPAYRIYEDETGTPILTGNMARLDDANTVGLYSESVTLSAANGFEVGKNYHVRITATVDGTDGVLLHTFTVPNITPTLTDILTDTGTTLQDELDGIASAVGSLNDLSTSDVQSAAAAALSAYDPPTKAEMDAAIADATPAQVTGTAQGAGTGDDTLQLAAGQVSQDDEFNGRMITIVKGAGYPRSRVILDTVASTNQIQVAEGDWETPPDNTTVYIIT